MSAKNNGFTDDYDDSLKLGRTVSYLQDYYAYWYILVKP